MTKKEWIVESAKFYYQIFTAEYDAKFMFELLKGGGGNSILCGSWMKISINFLDYRISHESLKQFDSIDFPYVEDEGVIYISWKDVKKNKEKFYSNAKSIKKRREKGKLFHFDHNPSNKFILYLIKEKVQELSVLEFNIDDKINLLATYIDSLQTIDIITIEQDNIRTSKDSVALLSKDERDKILNDNFYNVKWLL